MSDGYRGRPGRPTLLRYEDQPPDDDPILAESRRPYRAADGWWECLDADRRPWIWDDGAQRWVVRFPESSGPPAIPAAVEAQIAEPEAPRLAGSPNRWTRLTGRREGMPRPESAGQRVRATLAPPYRLAIVDCSVEGGAGAVTLSLSARLNQERADRWATVEGPHHGPGLQGALEVAQAPGRDLAALSGMRRSLGGLSVAQVQHYALLVPERRLEVFLNRGWESESQQALLGLETHYHGIVLHLGRQACEPTWLAWPTAIVLACPPALNDAQAARRLLEYLGVHRGQAWSRQRLVVAVFGVDKRTQREAAFLANHLAPRVRAVEQIDIRPEARATAALPAAAAAVDALAGKEVIR